MILRLRLYSLSLKVAIYLLPICAFYLGWFFWSLIWGFLGRPVLFSIHGHVYHMLFGTLVWAFVAERYRVTSFDELFRERTGARAAWSACLTASFILLALLYFSRDDIYPRGLLVCDLVVVLALTVFLHAIFRTLFRSSASMAKPTRILVVGADQFAREAALRLQRVSFAPAQIGGFVRLPGQEVDVKDHRVFELEQLKLLSANHGIDEAVIAIRPAQFSQIPKIMKTLKRLCLPTRALVDLGEGIVVRERLFQLGNIQMLDLSSTPTESLDYALFKRIFDICFSLTVLALTAPLLGLIALIIRLTSPGPIFFTQERIGLNGKPFKMYKFRSMRAGLTSESDTQWTTSEDNRKTSFGTLLRKTSLDELPQFINVLKGDMSVVGPRPERPHFVHKFLQEVSLYNHRHSLKVGITGWAQVNGWRGDTSIEKRVEFDLYYLQNWSFMFDLRIIMMTVFSGLINKNAY
ncbi:MAG TPA: exopolysaccharide biosynthesis polyprenyl glycosylphosphotransferase [Pyrinomonadaceae bacterium]|nr:exopolysaccharide biosynthesis polyprenyl glycosylphosphotransferase [Pyrinomonadaceae bacterium]